MHLKSLAMMGFIFLVLALAPRNALVSSAVAYPGEVWSVKADDKGKIATVLVLASYPDDEHGRIYDVMLSKPFCARQRWAKFVISEIQLIPSLGEIIQVSVDLEPHQKHIDHVAELLDPESQGSVQIHDRELKDMLGCG